MLDEAQPACSQAAKFRTLPANEHVQTGSGMRQSCRRSWEKTERVGLAVIITALLASEETKVPEDKHLKTRYIYCKADFSLSAL